MKRLLSCRLVWVVPFWFVFSLFFGWLYYRAEQAFYSPVGGPDAFFCMFPVFWMDVGIGVVSFFACFVGGGLACWRRTRFAGFIVLFCALAYLGGCGSRSAIFGDPRKIAWTQAGERMMPLIQAIEAYHHDHGAYPAQLEAVTPTYIDKLPSTGMANFTNFNYYVGEQAQYHEGNPWVIDIPACCGMGFNQFYYFPLQNYPTNWAYERMGKWAYFHE